MTTKHTPGPWRIGTLASYDGYTGQPFRNVWAGTDDAATVVARAIRSEGAMSNDVDADACLISAAPDLLEALQAIIGDGVHCDVVPHLHRKARAAIAKATGEQQ